MSLFYGTAVALVTPTIDSEINYDETDKLVERVTKGGADALVALGSTGEAATLDDIQKENFVSYIRKKTDMPLIVGVSSNNPDTVIKNCDMAMRIGADAALIATPFYNKCTQEGAYEFFEYIANKISLPFIVYNVPARTGFNLLPATTARICRIKGADGIKEASGSLAQIQKCLALGLNVYSGDDALTAETCMYGGNGVISVAANVAPKQMSQITSLCRQGKTNEAAKIQFDLLPLIETLFSEVNPIPVRAALKLVGIDCGKPRLPMTEATAATIEKLKIQLKELNIT